jgi:antitoxin (DNA-binding transcriptional repressor) of toxin-antitoxin stability system
LLSDTEEHGTTITITRRGQPIAQLVPIQSRPRVSMAGALAGKVRIPDDLLNEDRSVLWTVNSGE